MSREVIQPSERKHIETLWRETFSQGIKHLLFEDDDKPKGLLPQKAEMYVMGAASMADMAINAWMRTRSRFAPIGSDDNRLSKGEMYSVDRDIK